MTTATPSIQRRADYGNGCYRRAIKLEGDPASVRGELVDDFHHFAVDLRVDAGHVQEIKGEDIRVPWTTCPGALAPLRSMVGAPVAASILDLHRFTPPQSQCTHLHDLACLAVAHASRLSDSGGAAVRRYDVSLPDRQSGKTYAELSRDGEGVLSWSLARGTIESATPKDFQGAPLAGRPFKEILIALGNPDAIEAAWVLQRAVFVGTGRRHDFERMTVATEFASVVGGACHSFAKERVSQARKIPNTVRDFSDSSTASFDRE